MRTSVLSSALGSGPVFQLAAEAPEATLAKECERLRTAFPYAAPGYFVSNAKVAGPLPGKRGEGMLPLRFERAREALLAAVVAELEHHVGAKRLTWPGVREPVVDLGPLGSLVLLPGPEPSA